MSTNASAEQDAERTAAVQALLGQLQTGRVDEIGDFLLQHLADHGPDGFDVQVAAELVFDRIENDD